MGEADVGDGTFRIRFIIFPIDILPFHNKWTANAGSMEFSLLGRWQRILFGSLVLVGVGFLATTTVQRITVRCDRESLLVSKGTELRTQLGRAVKNVPSVKQVGGFHSNGFEVFQFRGGVGMGVVGGTDSILLAVVGIVNNVHASIICAIGRSDGRCSSGGICVV